MNVARWGLALVFACLATFVALMLLGVMAALFGSSMFAATYSDNLVDKYQALFGLTLAAGTIASIARLVILLRNRTKHKLRITEYPEHVASAGVLAGGLTYAALALIIATMRDVVDDSVSEEVLRYAVLYALGPMLVTYLAVFIAAADYVEKIPCSREPSKLEKDVVRAFGVMRSCVRLVIDLTKQRVRR